MSWVCGRCGARYPGSSAERGDGCRSCTKIVPVDADVPQEELVDQLRIQNGILLELVNETRRARAIAMGKDPGEVRKSSLPGFVEDSVLNLEERVDLDEVDRLAKTS